jgi:hypothetical protein
MTDGQSLRQTRFHCATSASAAQKPPAIPPAVTANPVPLFEIRAELVSSLQGSTTTRALELASFLDRALLAWERRADAANASAQQRSQRIRLAIRHAVGALPLDNPCTPGVIERRIARKPQQYGLDAPPHQDTIRDELKRMHAERISVPSTDRKSGGGE